MTHFVALLSGLIFWLGLILAGMANLEKVLAFLDISGAWDPSLALVMGGAIAIALPAFALAAKRNRSLLGQPISLPASRVIDKRLILGSIAFSIGWGVAGICPGPALVFLGTGNTEAMIFVGPCYRG